MRLTALFAALLLCACPRAIAAESQLPPPGPPQLVINHNGPHAPITALAFAPDGTLYAGGFGKLVHRYTLRNGKYVATDPIRIPIAGGNAGAINAIAVSPDGKWVAVAGRAPLRGELWAGQDDGIVVETQYFAPELKCDYGVVYVFNPADPLRGKVIRGPESEIRAIAFANPTPVDGPILVTAGIEWDTTNKHFGVVRVYDVAKEKELAVRKDLPATPTRPGLAAWVNSDKGMALRVAVAWFPGGDPGELLVWDVAAKHDERFPDGKFNVPLALRVGKNAAIELISGGFVATGGQLVRRPVRKLDQGQPIPLRGNVGQSYFPLAVAPLGADTAVLCQIDPAPAGTSGRPCELRILGGDGSEKTRFAMKGVDNDWLPILAVSPNGRYLAVGGFTDNRVEVYDAAALGDGPAKPQTIAGAPGDYSRVAFLTGNRLWIGGLNETAPNGGVVYDFVARKAADGAATGAGQRVDVSPGGGTIEPQFNAKTGVVTADIAGRNVSLQLRPGEVPTTAAYLPAGPTWDKKLGAVVAVAHYHRESAVSLITLFDATSGKPLLQLGGPALKITALALSGSRPLLAAVGEDRVVSVWTLKNLAAPFGAIEGLVMVERDGELAVSSVAPGSPASKAFKNGDIVEAVGGEVRDLKRVKTYREFLLAIRDIPIGKNARVRLKGNAAPVVVQVGTGVGHRHPLFDLWVNPTANKDGSHDWIGWTPAGPYDANSLAAESRLGWLTTTGNPAEPVRYAGADQYRRFYYKTNFLRFLVEHGEFNEALKKYSIAYPRTNPILVVRADGQVDRDGVTFLRSRPDNLDVRLDDPDQTMLLERAVLRWRIVGRDGKPGNWQDMPFRVGRVTIPLAGYVWSRGPHRFEVALQESPDGPVAVGTMASFVYIRPAPILSLRVNGAKLKPGEEPVSANEVVEITAEVVTIGDDEVGVKLVSSAPGGDTPIVLPAGKPGQFGPVKVKLHPDAKTAIRVTATNTAAGDYASYESDSASVTVWHATPQPKPVPKVRLSITSPVEAPTAPDRPFVSDTAKVRLSAAITAEKLDKVEWDDGDGKWVPVEFKPSDPKSPVALREITIAKGGEVRTLRVRVTAGGASRTDEVRVVWAAIPVVDFIDLPTTVRASELTVRASNPAAPGGVPFTVCVIAASSDPTIPRREATMRVERSGSLQADIRLTPGENQLGLIVGNSWKQARLAPRDVRYIRPPVIASVQPIAARGANVGDVAAVVVTPSGSPPSRLQVNGRAYEAKFQRGPITVCGLEFRWLTVEAVPLEVGGVLPKTIRIAARNADGDGVAMTVAVIPKPVAPPPPPPPVISVTTGTVPVIVSASGIIRTDQPHITLGLKVNSVAKPTRIELRRSGPVAGQQETLPGVSVEGAKAVPGGFELATNVVIALRDGVNQFEVIADTSTFTFSVSYTPPPVRVIIDAIEETGPNGVFAPLGTVAGGKQLLAATGFVRVRGRVVWSGTSEAARAAAYRVVLVANEVRHIPITLSAPAAGGREVPFDAPLFLNATDTQVRIEVQAPGRTDPVAQQLVADAVVAIQCRQPLTQQRLHVVVIGVQSPEDGGWALANKVVGALGGKLPADSPRLDRIHFEHKAFVRATLYRPLVFNVNRGNVGGLLDEVKKEIERSATESGGKSWQNDVVIVYYEGRDMLGADGIRRLHSTRSLPYKSNPIGEQFAIRMDEMLPTPGVRVPLLNVVNPDVTDKPDRITALSLLVRYAWKDPAAVGQLLPLFQQTVGKQPTLGAVVDAVQVQAESSANSEKAIVRIPNAVRARPLGGGGQ